MRFNTALLHSGKMGDEVTGATLTPIYQSSAFYQTSAEQHEKLFHNKANGFSYTRLNNPTITAFEYRMTALENGLSSIACASGMAAIFNALLNIVNAGEEILASTSLYGGSVLDEDLSLCNFRHDKHRQPENHCNRKHKYKYN